MIMTTFPHALKGKTVFLSILLFVIIMSLRLGGTLSQGPLGCAVKTRLTEPLQRHDSTTMLIQEIVSQAWEKPTTEPFLSTVFSWKSSYVGPSLSDDMESQEQKESRPSFSLSLLRYWLHPSIHPLKHSFSKDLFGSYHYAWCRAVVLNLWSVGPWRGGGGVSLKPFQDVCETKAILIITLRRYLPFSLW